MKILQLCKKFPYPMRDGEIITITYLSRALKQLGCDITLLTMNTSRHPVDIKSLPATYDHYTHIHSVAVDNRIKAVDAFFNLFTSKSYHLERFVSRAFEEKLKELLQAEKYDIIQLETLFLAPYIPLIRQYSQAKIVQRSFNVEFEIWQRTTNNTKWGLKKWYLALLTRRLRKYEIGYLNEYDLMVGITQRDLDIFRTLGCTIPGCVAPIGINMQDYNLPTVNSPTVSFCFIGGMDWMPNIEAVRWLLDDLWPLLVARFPQAQLHLAGRGTPAWLLEGRWENVTIHGEIPDAIDFIHKHAVMLVPLFAGGGMRTKIVEAMALRRTVITTAIGLEGIESQQGKNVLMAENVNEFLEQMIFCLENPEQLASIGNQAHQLVVEQFSNERVAKNLLKDYEKLLA